MIRPAGLARIQVMTTRVPAILRACCAVLMLIAGVAVGGAVSLSDRSGPGDAPLQKAALR